MLNAKLLEKVSGPNSFRATLCPLMVATLALFPCIKLGPIRNTFNGNEEFLAPKVFNNALPFCVRLQL